MTCYYPPDISEDAYETYLNEFGYEAVGTEARGFDQRWSESYGTWTRENDPIAFRCGYNDWIDFLEHNGDITYQCVHSEDIEAGTAEALPDGWLFVYEPGNWEYPPETELISDYWLDDYLELIIEEMVADELDLRDDKAIDLYTEPEGYSDEFHEALVKAINEYTKDMKDEEE